MNKFIFIALKYYVIIMIFSIFVPYFNYLSVEEIFILPDDDKLKILEFNENFMLYNYRDKLIRYDLTNFDKDILLENTGEIFELIITKENDYYYINQEKIEGKDSCFLMKNNEKLFRFDKFRGQHLSISENSENILFIYSKSVYYNLQKIPYFSNVDFASFLKDDNRILILTDNPPKDNTEDINENYFIYKPGYYGKVFKTSDDFIYIYSNKVDFILPGKFAQVNQNRRNDHSGTNRPIGLNRFLINNIVYDFYGNTIKQVDESFYTPNYVNQDNYAKFMDSYFDDWLTYDNLRNVRTSYLKTKVIFNNNIFKKFGYIKKHDRFKIAYDNKKGNKVGYIISGTNNSSFGYHQKLAVNNQITLNNYFFLSRVVYNQKNDSFMALAEKNDGNIYLIKTEKIKKRKIKWKKR